MAVVAVTNVVPMDNPTQFTNPFTFEITFQSARPLEEDLEWKLVYVGSPEDSSHDQVLVEVLVGPVPAGVNKFVLHGNPPNPALIPTEHIVGVTVIVLTCAYRSKEFVRVGYYVNNELLRQNPPIDDDDDDLDMDDPIDISLLYRTILADKPRVTRFAIDWAPRHPLSDFNASSPTTSMVASPTPTESLF